MKFIRAFSITLASQIIVVLGGIINNIIVVRALGPEGQGVYTLMITTSMMLLIFGGGGMISSNIYWAKRKRQEVSTIFINSVFFAVIVSLTAFLAYISFGKNFMLMFFRPDIAFIIIIAMPLLLIQDFNQGILWGLEKYDYHNFLTVFKAVFMICANAALLLGLKLGIKAAALGWFLVVSSTSVVSLFVLYKEVGTTYIWPRISVLIRSLRMGVKFLIADIAWFLYKRFDLYLIAIFLSVRQVGYYSIAVLIMQLANIIPIIFGKFIFANSADDSRKQTLLSEVLIKTAFAYSVFFALAILLLGKVIIMKFFGQMFIASFECLIFLLPATIMESVNIGIGLHITAMKAAPIQNIYIIFATFVSNVLFNVLLIPRLGINGAAISVSLSSAIQLCLTLFLLKKFNLKLNMLNVFNLRFAEIVKLVKSIPQDRQTLC